MSASIKAPWEIVKEKTAKGFTQLIKRYPDGTSSYQSEEEIQMGHYVQSLEVRIAELEKELEGKAVGKGKKAGRGDTNSDGAIIFTEDQPFKKLDS